MVEAGFDFFLEPYLRTHTAWEEIAERYVAVAEILAMGSVVWVVFSQLERVEHHLAARNRELAILHARAAAGEKRLQALHEASLRVISEGSTKELLREIVHEASYLTRARYGALAVFDEQERVVDFVTVGADPALQERVGLPTHRGLLGRLSQGPVRIDDVLHDPAFTGFPPDHPIFSSFLGVPIRWENHLLGHLYVGGHEGEEPFGEDEERLLQMFALDAAVAIIRARQAEEEREEARRVERQELAMRLHDDTLQWLYAAGLQLDHLRSTGGPSLETVTAAIQRAMHSIREMLGVLEPRDIATLASLQASVDSFAALCRTEVVWHDARLAEGLPASFLEEMDLILKEAVSNAARHAGARFVHVFFERTESSLALRVRDEAPSPRISDGGSRGLHHLRVRAQRLGGTVSWHKLGEQGAELLVSFPLPPTE